MRARGELLLVLVLTACGSDGLETADLPDRLTCFGAVSGSACDMEDQWCASTIQCGLDISYCKCTDGHYSCTEPYSPEEISECTVVANASCFLEGTGVCDREPVGGGSCGCTDGAWLCDNACDGCPSSLAVDGQACTTTHACRYFGPPETTCTCTNGVFDCT